MRWLLKLSLLEWWSWYFWSGIDQPLDKNCPRKEITFVWRMHHCQSLRAFDSLLRKIPFSLKLVVCVRCRIFAKYFCSSFCFFIDNCVFSQLGRNVLVRIFCVSFFGNKIEVMLHWWVMDMGMPRMLKVCPIYNDPYCLMGRVKNEKYAKYTKERKLWITVWQKSRTDAMRNYILLLYMINCQMSHIKSLLEQIKTNY